MDADWDELRIIPHVGPLPQALPTPISAIAFDAEQELIWIGNTYGRVRTFYGPSMQTYQSHVGHRGEVVRQIIAHEKGAISLSAGILHLAQRTGRAIWNLRDRRFLDLYCMAYTSKGTNELLIAGSQDTMLKVDVDKGQVTETVPTTAGYKLMKRAGQYICAATFTGAVHILNAQTLQVVKVWQAHLGVINDMDARSDFLVTCGLSQRQQHGLMPDPMANVLDLKSLMPLPPIPFQPGAAFVRMHPKMSTTSIVASQTGQLQVVDIMNPHTVSLKQAHIYDNAYLTGIELAATGEALALTSSMCQVHFWGSPSRFKFAEFSNPIKFADSIGPETHVSWSEDTPLNTIGLPYYREQLLSSWPNTINNVGLLPPEIEPEVLASKTRGELGSYAPALRTKRPNQIEYRSIENSSIKNIAPPKFLSEKARETTLAPEEDRGFTDAISDLKLDGVTRRDVPHIYRNVEIKYSKFGVDDFDFEFYNKTQYSGLETHILNSYANPLLQLYRFTPVLRNLTLYHTSTSCLMSDCILCELGFLIDMLEKAAGQNCQASNFLKTFSGLPAAHSLNVLEEHSSSNALTSMIQAANNLLLNKFTTDFRRQSSQNLYFEQAIATPVVATVKCAHCSHEQVRPETPLSHNLIYPTKNMLRTQPRGLAKITFSQVLKASVERQESLRGWCQTCRRYQQLHTSRRVQRVPTVIMLNTMILSNEAKQLWSNPEWLPSEIGIIVEQGQFYCYQDQDLKLHLQRGVYNIQVYELIGVVSEVISVQKEKPHLVSLINVSASSTDTSDESQWHLFNDFLVQPTSKDDALKFDSTWKLPCVLAYQLKSASHLIDEDWKANLDTTILYEDIRFGAIGNPHGVTALSQDNEAPKAGTHVGIDAEFVSLQSEEIEIKADGTRETIRPSRLGLARVSVLRGDGDQMHLPFIDDYVEIKEPIVDYLTAFSGIQPGDLDPHRSTHPLVTLKVAYKKLWLLLNLGCIFVGHGLLKDFRTINMHVPRAQVIDTVDMWFIRSRARKLNLRFLSWLLLDINIQSGESHDSVEDARSALQLWRKYVEVQLQGKTEETLDWVYRRGREVGFRAPGAAGYKASGVGTTAATSAAADVPDTPGRGTPEPGALPSATPRGAGATFSIASETFAASTNDNGLVGTPSRKGGFGSERIGFGSPLR